MLAKEQQNERNGSAIINLGAKLSYNMFRILGGLFFVLGLIFISNLIADPFELNGKEKDFLLLVGFVGLALFCILLSLIMFSRAREIKTNHMQSKEKLEVKLRHISKSNQTKTLSTEKYDNNLTPGIIVSLKNAKESPSHIERIKSMSILRALQEQNQDLAMTAIKQGGDIHERDEHGNFPLHYSAALGYTNLIEELVCVNVDIETKNNKGKTPLVYAMMYDQFHASKVLWNYQRKRIDCSNSFSKLVVELCTIGVDRTLPPEHAKSGYLKKDSPLQFHHHPRAREIGQELFLMGGFSIMQKAAERVSSILGRPAAHDLSACWNGVGTWQH